MFDDQHKAKESHVSNLILLATSGITGVLIKHVLEAAFRSEVEHPFNELPANMVGCFFMGFMTRASSIDAAAVSFAGSITSFAAWNQAMVSAAYNGQWVYALSSLLIGVELAHMSYKVGLDVADILCGIQAGFKLKSLGRTHSTTLSYLLSCFLWLSVSMLAVFDTARSKLWLACAVAPHGVWTRYLLARMNHSSTHQWLPLGTWITNIIASTFQAALALVTIMDPTTGFIVDAFQRGFLGSMSTLSTAVAETHSLHSNEAKAWQAYSYMLSTMLVCLLLGAVIYGGPLALLKTPTITSQVEMAQSSPYLLMKK